MIRIAALILIALLGLTVAFAGSLDNTNTPSPTMVSLNEIYERIMVLRQNLDLPDGPPSAPGVTGQTNSWQVGDDGYYRAGRNPVPRFTVGAHPATNTVVDNLTGLMWARVASPNSEPWSNSMEYCEALLDPSYGPYTDWRMPNIREMESLLDYSGFKSSPTPPGLPPGHPFDLLNQPWFWTSTPLSPASVWFIDVNNRNRRITDVTGQMRVLPVRGGSM